MELVIENTKPSEKALDEAYAHYLFGCQGMGIQEALTNAIAKAYDVDKVVPELAVKEMTKEIATFVNAIMENEDAQPDITILQNEAELLRQERDVAYERITVLNKRICDLETSSQRLSEHLIAEGRNHQAEVREFYTVLCVFRELKREADNNGLGGIDADWHERYEDIWVAARELICRYEARE